MKRSAILCGSLFLLVACSPLLASEIIYFKNQRTIEAEGYHMDNGLIYITMTNGREVYLRADMVDWSTTERIGKGNVTFHKLPYEELETAEAGGKNSYITQLTNTDLKRKKYARKYKRTINISVYGAKPWTDTGIDLKLGQDIVVSAHGAIKIWGSKDAPPNGILSEQAAAGEMRVLPERSFGCIIGKVGAAGTPFYCGSRKPLRSPVNGRLYLGPNDRNPEDNTGFWDISIAVAKERKYAPGFSTTGYTRTTAAPSETSPAPQPPVSKDFKRVRPGY